MISASRVAKFAATTFMNGPLSERQDRQGWKSLQHNLQDPVTTVFSTFRWVKCLAVLT